MEFLQTIFNFLIDPNSIWAVVARGVLWLVVAVVIIVSVDTPKPEESLKNLKANLGFLLLFMFLSGTLIFLLFGFAPMGKG